MNELYPKNLVFISWQPYCSRSDHIARELGGESNKIYYSFFGSRYSTVLFKYFFQLCKTLWILFKKRPQIVFVMSPPVFANIPVYIYSKIFKTEYVIDAHTGAFNNPLWKTVQGMQKFFFQSAAVTITTNETLKLKAEEWGATSIVIPDVPILITDISSSELDGSINILLINTFASDEPLSNFLEATRFFPDVSFYISGKFNDKNMDILNHSSNVKFTNFLPDRKFYGLLSDVDIAIALTTKDNTMQRGAYEAIYAGTPVITSNWEVLRKNFPQGSIFVDNSVEGIAMGIDEALLRLDQLKQEALELKRIKMQNWVRNKGLLSQILSLNY